MCTLFSHTADVLVDDYFEKGKLDGLSTRTVQAISGKHIAW